MLTAWWQQGGGSGAGECLIRNQITPQTMAASTKAALTDLTCRNTQ
jgi:hypothetical protein